MSDTYYAKYWSDAATAIPNGDPSTGHRVELASSFVKGKTVLDYGCGGGISSKLLGRYAASVMGMDIAENAIRMANEDKPANVEFRVGSLPEVKQLTEKYDAIFLGDVLEHLYDCVDALTVLREFALRPDGQLIITVPYYGFLKMQAVLLSGGFGAHFDPMGPHVRFFDFASLTRTLKAAGFRMVINRGYGRPIPFMHRGIFAVATPG
jgi:2-polyprenyl-3-methyl-5-hydroxy-6-metoxy-1,4-benzoquinol methylase